jgi:hypothetical protein
MYHKQKNPRTSDAVHVVMLGMWCNSVSHTIGSYIACKIALAVPDDLYPLTHTFSAILIL